MYVKTRLLPGGLRSIFVAWVRSQAHLTTVPVNYRDCGSGTWLGATFHPDSRGAGSLGDFRLRMNRYATV